MTQQLRAVVGARVSVLKGDEKVSHYAQHETGQTYAERQGWPVVGTFQDLDVSATVSPWDRPDLGPWLTDERAGDWDVMIFSKIDRAFRSIRDCVKLAEWIQERKKVLVFADDGLMLDYKSGQDDKGISAMMAELFVYLGAFFGQIELNRFKSRATDSHSVLRYQDRWAGGPAPYGYVSAPHPSGKGRTLVPDSESRDALQHMASMLVSGDSFNAITQWLIDNGYPTNRDRLREPENREGTQWATGDVINILTSDATQGVKMTGQKGSKRPILDNEGKPVQLAPPTFDQSTWRQIQTAAQERRTGPHSRVHKTSPVLGVAVCGECEQPLTRTSSTNRHGVTYSYYRCRAVPKRCPGIGMKSGDLEQLLEEAFMFECGNLPVTRKVFVPGEDHTEELGEVNRTIDRLRGDREAGLFIGEDDEQRYREQMGSLLARRETLKQLPQRKAGWRDEETGRTYAEAWPDADESGRRKMLVDAGARFTLYGVGRYGTHFDRARLEQHPGYDTWLAEREERAAEARREWGIPED